MKTKTTKMKEKTTKDYLLNEINKTEILSCLNDKHINFFKVILAQTKCAETKTMVSNYLKFISMREDYLLKSKKIF
jgi:hypothetical protein